MDKNAIKKYAVWARRELIERVCDPNADSVNGYLLSQVEKRQRQALIAQIREKGFQQVMEEVAYTWFNRFAALRFMEVNGYLPTHIRVFTNDTGEFKPQILTEAIHLELDGLDMNRVYELENANKSEELFKYLLIVQCNALNSILPGMFQKIEDYTELLLPDNLLREGSVIEQMVTMIPEEDWTDQVQIIGWLYQYYNTELNEYVYDGSYARNKIVKELLPAATTIYTPDWPVHYMVENSLGRLWLEGHPNDALKSEWKYYLDETEQEAEVQTQLATIRKEYAAMKPEEIRVIDPCMGSGHILCVLFDVLVRIYEDYGYTAREAAAKIVENNLWGLDIDDRAAQLSYFAVMMKARQYDRRFFTRNVQPHVYAIHETNAIKYSYEQAMGDFLLCKNHQATLNYLMKAFTDAKEYGSILLLEDRDYVGLKDAWEIAASQTAENFNLTLWYADVAPEIPQIIEQAIALAQKYDVVITNPPYLSSSRFSPKLDKYVKEHYSDEKSDLCMVMFKKGLEQLSAENGFVSFITTSSWMFLSSFEKVRKYLLNTASISSLVDFGTELFEGKVGHNPIVSWITRNSNLDYRMTAIRLVEFCYSRRNEKQKEFFNRDNRYTFLSGHISQIPGCPIAYWVKSNDIVLFSNATIQDINNGGEFRRWYGNNYDVVNWQNDGEEIKSFGRAAIRNKDFYLYEGITWTAISSAKIAVRRFGFGFLFSSAGFCIFSNEHGNYLLALLNSNVGMFFLKIFSPTMNFNVGDIARIPVLIKNKDRINNLSAQCIEISKEDWDSFEISWDFKEHPFITSARWALRDGEAITIKQAFEDWTGVSEGRFHKLKENEEELNRTFIDIYGLEAELTPEIEDKDVTVRKADLQRDIRSFISYAVGCMFGRYSLDVPGLIYAGGNFEDKFRNDILTDENGNRLVFGNTGISLNSYVNKKGTWVKAQYAPDADNIIPICDDEYFEDDIVGCFVKFVEAAYGKGNLEENLRYIADALGGKGSSREVIRGYFINDFYADHLKVYQKRRIYWLFDSGKKNGFKCLIYMHRYQPDTIARIRTDYVHEQQSRYRTAIADLETRIANAGTSERVKLTKQLTKIQEQAEELRVYEEKIHHLADQMIRIDLDDGVKVNYAKFQDVLAKIK